MKDMRGQNKRKYTVNDSYFNCLDKEKAYWLGVLYADGNVSSNKKNTTGRVIFSSTDKDWIEIFSKMIEYTGPIREEIHKVFKKSIWKITIDSRKMYDDLIKLGCVEKKSLILQFPDLEKDLISHFIRGYFDGDGSVTVCKNLKGNDWKILKASICGGSEKFISKLKDLLPIVNKKYYKGKRIFEIKMSLKDSISFYNFIYKDANVYLKRKYLKFYEYLLNYQSKRSSTTTISHPKKDEGIV